MRCIHFLILLFAFCYLAKSAVVFPRGKCPSSGFFCDIVCSNATKQRMCEEDPLCCTSDTECEWNQKCCPPSCGCVNHCVNVTSIGN